MESFVIGLAVFGAGYVASFVFLPPLASHSSDFEHVQREYQIFFALSLLAAILAGVVSFILRRRRKL